MTTKKTTKRVVKKAKVPNTKEMTNEEFYKKIDDFYAKAGDWDYDNEPDSEATVEQVKGYGTFSWGEPEPTNYWKYACIAILLGIVSGMIISTPLFVKLAEVCTY